MAIVRLNKLSVVGLNSSKEKVLSELMALGFVEIDNQEDKLADESWGALLSKDGNEERVAEFDTSLTEVGAALDALDKYYPGKTGGLFKTRSEIKSSDFNKALERKSEITARVENVNELYRRLLALKNEQNKNDTFVLGLKPWVDYDVPLEMTETVHTAILIGTIPASAQIETFEKAVTSVAPSAIVYKISTDNLQHYISVVCIKTEREGAMEEMRNLGFNPVVFGDVAGKAAENISKFEARNAEIDNEIKGLEETLTKESETKQEIEMLYDYLVVERDKNKMVGNLIRTNDAFYFDGWLPAKRQDKVEKILDENGCYYEIKAPEKGEETPVVMQNNAAVYPFEAITNLYGVPSSADIDPSPFIAVFYFIFFGMMLSDAAYGIILFVACLVISRTKKLEGLMDKLIKMFMLCGISTIFWGFMFGTFFGNVIPVVSEAFAGARVVLEPWWFDPIEEPMKLLIFSVALGLIHLFVGMGIKAYMYIRDGQILDAIFDIFFWYAFILGLIAWIGGGMISPGLSKVGLVLTLIGGIGILCTGGREKKNIFGKIIGGLGSLYNITGYLSDALSYSRILALGLATSVVSQVFNQLGTMFGDNIAVKAIIFIVVFIIGHVFNIFINALGSFVHASRLQYVEFFGKFFEGGGTAFEPFDKKTKYVKIIEEE